MITHTELPDDDEGDEYTACTDPKESNLIDQSNDPEFNSREEYDAFTFGGNE